MRLLPPLLILLAAAMAATASDEQAVGLFNRANGYYGNARYGNAIIMYKKARALGVDPAVCSFNIGNCYFQAGDLPAAAAAYRSAAMEHSAIAADALLNLGGVFYRLGNFGESISAYRSGLSSKPDNLSGWLYLSEAYQKCGDFVNALYALEQAYRLRPDDVSIVYQLAETHLSLKEFPEAVALVKTAFTLNPDETDFLFYIAEIHIMNKDTASALSAFREALGADPENFNGHYRIADILASTEQPYMAIEHLSTALGIKPDFTDAAVFLGNLAFDLQWWDRSINAYAQAVKYHDREGILGIINVINELVQRKQPDRARSVAQVLDGTPIDDPALRREFESVKAQL